LQFVRISTSGCRVLVVVALVMTLVMGLVTRPVGGRVGH
jgi:hypothetical protein